MKNFWKEFVIWTSSFVTKKKSFYLVILCFFFLPLIILITDSFCYTSIRQTIVYMAIILVFLSFFASMVLVSPYRKTKNNWRLAINRIRGFAKKHPQYQKEINQLILVASKYRRSQDIIDWLEAWKEYQKEKEELELMKARRQQLPETISRMETELVNLPSQIEKQKAKVKELEQWLSGEEDGE